MGDLCLRRTGDQTEGSLRIGLGVAHAVKDGSHGRVLDSSEWTLRNGGEAYVPLGRNNDQMYLCTLKVFLANAAPVLLVVFLSSVTHSFPTNIIPEGPHGEIQNSSMRPILNRTGYAQSPPPALLFGPQPFGGTCLRLSMTHKDPQELVL
jgi:hypothetical protein